MAVTFAGKAEANKGPYNMRLTCSADLHSRVALSSADTSLRMLRDSICGFGQGFDQNQFDEFELNVLKMTTDYT